MWCIDFFNISIRDAVLTSASIWQCRYGDRQQTSGDCHKEHRLPCKCSNGSSNGRWHRRLPLSQALTSADWQWLRDRTWFPWNLSFLYISLYWSIHTKDESKCGTAFAFIFGVNWLWRCGVTASFGVIFFMKVSWNSCIQSFQTYWLPAKSVIASNTPDWQDITSNNPWPLYMFCSSDRIAEHDINILTA